MSLHIVNGQRPVRFRPVPMSGASFTRPYIWFQMEPLLPIVADLLTVAMEVHVTDDMTLAVKHNDH